MAGLKSRETAGYILFRHMALGKKTGGRNPGSPNRATTRAKDAILQTFRELGDIPEMVAWAKDNKTEFYKLFARLVPTEVHNNNLIISNTQNNIEVKESPKEFARRVAFVLNAGLAELAEEAQKAQQTIEHKPHLN